MPHRIILCPTPFGTSIETYFKMIPSSVWWHLNWPGLELCIQTRCYSSIGPFPLIVSTKWLLKHKAMPVGCWYLIEIFLDAHLLPGSSLTEAEIWNELAFWFWHVIRLQDASPHKPNHWRIQKDLKISFNKVYQKKVSAPKCYFDSCLRHRQLKWTHSSTLSFISLNRWIEFIVESPDFIYCLSSYFQTQVFVLYYSHKI